MNGKLITDQDTIISAFQKSISEYGKSYTCTLESLFRNETAHFQSTQWLNCYSPGMEMTKGTDKPCYGWSQLDVFWTETKPEYAPIGIWSAVDNDSALIKSTGLQGFLKFPSVEAGILSVAKLISLRDGNFGSWFSTQQEYQNQYSAILKTIIPRFCNVLPENKLSA